MGYSATRRAYLYGAILYGVQQNLEVIHDAALTFKRGRGKKKYWHGDVGHYLTQAAYDLSPSVRVIDCYSSEMQVGLQDMSATISKMKADMGPVDLMIGSPAPLL
ncbi:unnamed protein product [Symbiodinium necroappetens]|uniref:Uncharacterized protein n=1 Tax=Symbiodinium necroappetens TaxID=1628268 RepID=A0A813C0I8_9DINO|nr:unnamed protein product [Symbiodinium necroappetens]